MALGGDVVESHTNELEEVLAVVHSNTLDDEPIGCNQHSNATENNAAVEDDLIASDSWDETKSG